jgi:hypothetical protein
MTNDDLVTDADMHLMQGLAQYVTVTRPDMISVAASYEELAWIWGHGNATWPRRLWALQLPIWWRGPGPSFRAGRG